MKIVVVGGVAGGMSAAARLRRLREDAQIIVLEAGPEVSFANCGLPYFVSGEIEDKSALLVQTPQSLKASLNLDARVNSKVTSLDPTARKVVVEGPEGTYELQYDELIVSPGAEAFRPNIEGIDSPRVTTLRTVSDALKLDDMAKTAQSAVVIGAGFIGLEAAEALHMRGVETTVVEFADHVLPPLDTETAFYVTEELHRLGIDVRAATSVDKIEVSDDADTAVLSDGSRVVADIIVLSAGVRPRTQIWEKAGIEVENGAIVVDEYGRTNVANVWAMGDAATSVDLVTGIRRPVALAGPANRAGRLVADAISGNLAHAVPKTSGTAIVRIGELTAAMTGANQRALEATGIIHHTISLHPLNHAGYFPGASQIHLRVHFGDDGKVLGAQAAGKDGVDKRIDVLATAIKAGMSVHDLIDLDLAYSPPYGSAKDPVNMAGMIASNVLDGTMPVWHTKDLDAMLENRLILDVRSAAEFAGGHLPGALNIAHTELRDRLDEVREAAAGRAIAVHCLSGVRSYLALRILQQAGFEVANYTGGLMTMRAELGERANEIFVH
ncbi:NADPH-dependent 2,4-dienoyl-CoA reductase/sulfur reductase-like enzyme/rhodanese-related sulfurtransferase [Trueperella bonasi]|uniref:NADPH-dependent 2,4-dienoyl-CoA reductase/sulfur reductase-like enzyme/rhodanese-related sulfurtransferase n=1 Tax=Trueperella bonasi TaxID=312286 RepID=A0ABT9NGJ7_9ACTO|nr:FAD-dependent oxidoreductase [Trueperella bonasi]MDP9806529.1 NADPH-dependent 2,4-dienoyl-CoA reductase/sulfur reductase-like enzyme/rhodanese-related sulfurtransferase [Trueperella bonasi]